MTDGTAPPPPAHEIHELGQLVARLDDDTGHDLVVQGLDLIDHDDLVLATTWAGSVLLGCRLGESARDHVVATGGVVFPPITGVPYRPYRSQLYDRDELLAGYERGRPGSIEDTLDHRIYRHQGRYRGPDSPEIPILEALAQRLHDHAIDNALANLLARHPRVVAVMGGHALRRDEPAYRRVARLGRRLTEAGYLVATGGGPGAMEAANLGAWMSGRHPTDLDDAVAVLARVGDYRAPGYLDAGFEVLDRWPDGADSLAIPTWFYGHEPTNQFATHIAKYFSNSLREDGLLAIATHGVVYTPGMAGTVQEIFMDATQNHYGTFHVVSPMVFLGRDYWTTTLPAVPLVRRLAEGRAYASYLAVTDDPDEAVAFIVDHPPTPA